MPDSNMDFARAALAQRRSTFLSLAPATSDSFPRCRPQQQQQQHQGEGEEDEQHQSPPRSMPTRTRRASSFSGFKVLKLGPVHNGEHLGQHQDDFHAIDESGTELKEGSGGVAPRSSFLTLAPTVSASYPRKPSSRPPAAYENHSRGGSSSSRRFSTSSSCSSSSLSSSSPGLKVLKLVPVYWGEHVDDHKADFYDVVPTSP